ncbi:hypothetical protein [Aurantiacibacter spongiae]|uniref:hypothetical protein n=1 Tax=Aurantiacibacter spongiae TaxID=2488860 RepID=UPI0013154B85|nr:hypothetical protein [Aurantiacibacter spongiae]
MRSIVEFLVHFLLAITGALGTATVIVGSVALLCGGGVLGGGWCLRAWRRKVLGKPPRN